MPVAGDHASRSVYQASHGRLRGVLRGALRAAMDSESGVASMGFRAGVALDSLLAAHPVDRRGRCRSCRGRGWLARRRRVCMVFQQAHYWLRQPTDRVITHLASEWGVDVLALPGATGLAGTKVPSRVADDSPTDYLQTPAVPPASNAALGRPDRDHGGVGERTDSPRFRRITSDNPSSGFGSAAAAHRKHPVATLTGYRRTSGRAARRARSALPRIELERALRSVPRGPRR
ncbi:MAG: hypothetical protein ACRDS1_06185 [Pseudonocardiaceae bacterium]